MVLAIGSCKWATCQEYVTVSRIRPMVNYPLEFNCWNEFSHSSVTLVLQERPNKNHSELSEEYAQRGDCSWYIVTYVVQCQPSLLVEIGTLSLSSMITRGAACSTSLREGVKSQTNLGCLRDVLQMIAGRTSPRYEAKMVENACQKFEN